MDRAGLNDESFANDQRAPAEATAPEASLVPDSVATGLASQGQSKWLLAHEQSALAQLTFSDCVCFSDLHGDGDYRLVIADLGRIKSRQPTASGSTADDPVPGNPIAWSSRLLVLRGTSVQSELSLPEPPVGVVSFRIQSQTPADGGGVLGVAAGSCIYVYRNLKPFYKFAMPPAPLDADEQAAWTAVHAGQTSAEQLHQRMVELQTRIGQQQLTAQSQTLIGLTDPDQRKRLVKKLAAPGGPAPSLRRSSVITCVQTMRKTGGELDQSCCLLVGTEQQQLLIIEPHAFTVLLCVQLAATPVFLQASGAFEVDFRLLITCRDAQVYTLRRGWPAPRLAVQLTAQPVAMLKLMSNLVVGCMNRTLSAYNTKGACLWSLTVDAPITAMASLHVQMLGVRLVAVALRSGEIRFYNEKQLVDRLRTERSISAMRFGRFGREENTLLLVFDDGGIQILILKRTAKFFNLDPVGSAAGQTPAAASLSVGGEMISAAAKLNIPKKTKLFVDQTMHERENSVSIHRTFQEDLYRFRLTTARAYVKAISSSLNPISMNIDTPVKLSAQVHGLGPIFRLMIEVQNTSLDKASTGLYLTFACDRRIYRVHRNHIAIPYLTPGVGYQFATQIEMVSELNLTDAIKVHVAKEREHVPVISAVINMPTSEPIA